MKVFITTVQLWFILLYSIAVAERSHAKERNRRVRWVRLARRCWGVRSLLSRVVRGDPTYIKGWVEGYSYPYLVFFEQDGQVLTLLDVVVTSKPKEWYYVYVTWGEEKIPAPWVDAFYEM